MARRILVVAWIVAAGAVGWMLIGGVRESEAYAAVRHLLHLGYAVALLWFLWRGEPRPGELPELDPPLLPRTPYGAWIPVVVMGLLLGLAVLSDDGEDLLMLSLMLASIWTLVAWWRRIRLRAVIQGVTLAGVACLAGMPAASHGLISWRAIMLLSVLAAPMYVAGGLLVEHTRLGEVRLAAGRYAEAGLGFLRGCLLFVPLGLVNAADGGPGDDIGWVTEWWMPFSLPWFSGIAEEIWFRLFLIGLAYFFLRPATEGGSVPAIVAAVLFGSIVFGLGHGRDLATFVTTGFLYGVPMAAVFVRRDWEHAVGAHYMVNLVSWIMVYEGR